MPASTRQRLWRERCQACASWTSRPRGSFWHARPGAWRRRGDILAYIDADCRVPLLWMARVERRFLRRSAPVAVTGPYRFYDWDWMGRTLIRAYDLIVAPADTCTGPRRARGRCDSLRRQFRRDAGRTRADCGIRPLDRVSRRGYQSRAAADAARIDRVWRRSAGSGPRRDATTRWASARCSGCTSETSGRKSFAIVPRIVNILM